MRVDEQASSAASWSDADEAYEIVERGVRVLGRVHGRQLHDSVSVRARRVRTRRVRRRRARSRRGVRRCAGRRTDRARRATRGGSGRIAACRVPRVSRIKGTARDDRRGSEKGVGRALADVDADVTHASEAARRAARRRRARGGNMRVSRDANQRGGGEGSAGEDWGPGRARRRVWNVRGRTAAVVRVRAGVRRRRVRRRVFRERRVGVPRIQRHEQQRLRVRRTPGRSGNERMETSGLIHPRRCTARRRTGGENRTFAYCACAASRATPRRAT